MAIRDELDAINDGFGEAFATQDAERLSAFYAVSPTEASRSVVDAASSDEPPPSNTD